RFIDTEEFVAERRKPVHQWRLFEPWHSVQPWRDVVSAQQHLTRNGGVPRFIGPDESYAPAALREKNVGQTSEHSDPPEVVITEQRGFHVTWTALRSPKKYAKISRMRAGIKELTEYTLALLLIQLFRIMPRTIARRAAAIISRLGFHLARRQRRAGLHNLR